jgi:hypothetical protein
MNALRTAHVAEQLSERDLAILGDLDRFRLLTTGQIQRLHFAEHASSLASARACNRALVRLRELGVIGSLDRRIGGVRRGSASYVWQLDATGERFLRTTAGHAHRRRFLEPGATFVNHTLAVNEVAVSLIETARSNPDFRIESLVTEPANWRSYLGAGGETNWLKPDLYAVTIGRDASGDYEEHAFLEIDLGTEHMPRIQAKCRMYAAYGATGAYQTEHGLFPSVVWLSSDAPRRQVLRKAISLTKDLPGGVFRVASPSALLVESAATPDEKSASPATPDRSTPKSEPDSTRRPK